MFRDASPPDLSEVIKEATASSSRQDGGGGGGSSGFVGGGGGVEISNSHFGLFFLPFFFRGGGGRQATHTFGRGPRASGGKKTSNSHFSSSTGQDGARAVQMLTHHSQESVRRPLVSWLL